jgi:hypothetical protein
MALNALDPVKAALPIVRSLDPPVSVTFPRARHNLKAERPMLPTESGMAMHLRTCSSTKASSPIDRSDDRSGNATLAGAQQPLKA